MYWLSACTRVYLLIRASTRRERAVCTSAQRVRALKRKNVKICLLARRRRTRIMPLCTRSGVVNFLVCRRGGTRIARYGKNNSLSVSKVAELSGLKENEESMENVHPAVKN